MQIHTPRDPNWSGDKVLGIDKGASPEEVALARAEWAREFVDACLKAGLGAAAITDHHDWVMIKHIREEIENRWAGSNAPELWVYPGVEMTCRDSAQSLLIFDADIDLQLLDRLPARLKLAADRKTLDTTHPQIQILNIDIEKLQDVLNEDPELKDRFIVLPNVKPGGHKTILRDGFHMRYAMMPYVGGYLEGLKPSQIERRGKNILDGKVEAWGSKRVPAINTSDARRLDRIGEDTPWIKVGATTAEALRQAFLAPDSRLSEDRPLLPAACIQRVKVTGAKVLHDLEADLNPQLIALIGGRGSGKSTLLEYIRFGLGYSPTDGDNESDARRVALVRDTLISAKGHVELEISINGSVSVLRRSGEKTGVITQAFPDGAVLELTPKDVQSNFPFQAYSQGELSKIGELGAGDKIKALILAPLGEQTARNEGRAGSVKSEIRSAFEGIVQMWKTEQQLREAQIKLENLRGQLVAIKALTDQAPVNQATLANSRSKVMTATSRLERVLADLKAALKWLANAPKLTAIGDLHIGFPDLSDLPEFSAVVKQIDDVAIQCQTDWTTTLPGLVTKFDQACKAIESSLQDWAVLRQALDTSYQQAVAQTKEFEVALNTRTSIDEAIVATEHSSRELSNRQEMLAQSMKSFDDLRSQMQGFRDEQRNTLIDMSSRFQEFSKGLARATVVVGGNAASAFQTIRDLTAQTRTRQDKLDALFDWLKKQADPHSAWADVQNECVAYLRWRELGSRPEERPESKIFCEQLGESSLSRISAERVVDVVSTFLEDDVRLGYMRGDEEVAFNTASPGEQATALLAVLLSQQGGPLILDQPEDDLDNKIIKDIVDYIRLAKQSRQIIMATHNANLVVNGDAEQVLHFQPAQTPVGKSCILSDGGAIDTSEVKNAITSTMEGGRAAFELRRTKYRF